MGACLCPARRLRDAAAARRGRRVRVRLPRREPHALHVARRCRAGICRQRCDRKRDDRPVRRRTGLCAGSPSCGADPRQPRDQGAEAATGGGRLPARRRRGPQPSARARRRRAGRGSAGPAGGGARPLGALMALRTAQPNFSKGVISDELVARSDVAAYASGRKRAENVIILKYGGVTKRPGTRLVAEVYKKSIDADFTGVIAGDTLTVSDCVGAMAVGQAITNGDGDTVATVTAFGSGTGGNGTYLVTPSQTLASASLRASVGAPVRLIPFQFSIEQTYALEIGQGYMRPAANGGLVIEDRLTITDLTPGATTTVEAAFHDYEIGDQVYFAGVEGTTELNGRIGRVIAAPDDDHFTVDIDSTGFSAFTGDTCRA